MNRACYNHTLQANPGHHVEETHNTVRHKALKINETSSVFLNELIGGSYLRNG